MPNLSFVANYRDQSFLMKIGQRIDEIRIEKKLTHEMLAKRMGVTETRQVGRVINAVSNFSASELSRFANALGVHPRELLDFHFEINEQHSSNNY